MSQELRIGRIKESDVDRMIREAGGNRVVEDSSIESEQNADYLLGDAIIELKLVEEEGLAKSKRQDRIAKIFQDNQPDRPTVVLDPGQLSSSERSRYDNIIGEPIKRVIKKASKQLGKTQIRLGGELCRVCLLINNGYTGITHDELRTIAARRARNDTSRIDTVVIGGLYFFSDQIDSFTLWPLEQSTINLDHPFDSFEALCSAWNRFAKQFMTDFVLRTEPEETGRLPVMDLGFEQNGIRFVRPAPNMGKPSEFWQSGRPRANTTGITTCPPIALTFPSLTETQWRRFKAMMPNDRFLESCFQDYVAKESDAASEPHPAIKPFVPVTVTVDEFEAWQSENGHAIDGFALCDYAAQVFWIHVGRLLEQTRELDADMIVPPRYILLRTAEIGQDKANDLSSIYLVHEIGLSGPADYPLVENVRMFHEHGLALGAAYAIKHRLGHVLYERNQTYAWV